MYETKIHLHRNLIHKTSDIPGVVEVHQLPDMIRILDQGRLVATHPVLEGRRQYRIDPGHRLGAAARAMRHGYSDGVTIARTGNHVAQRSLAFYGAIGDQLASGNVTATGDRS